jgi:hypothetical protein
MLVFQGPDEENGERSVIVRPSLLSRPMSPVLAVYRFILQARKTKTVLYYTVLRGIFLAGKRHVFKVRCIYNRNPLAPDRIALESHLPKTPGPRGSGGCRNSNRGLASILSRRRHGVVWSNLVRPFLFQD